MAAPPGPHAPPRRRQSGVVGPMVLIVIGGVFLLQNLGYLPPTAWSNLWRLWPLVLVVAGLELLLAGRVPGAVLALLVLAATAVGLFAFEPGLPLAAPEPASLSRDTPLGGASQAEVSLRFGAGELAVGPLVQADPATPLLASMRYAGPAGSAPTPRFSLDGSTASLEYQASGRGLGFVPFIGGPAQTGRLDVDLATGVPITSLVVQAGASDAHLDLGSLRIDSLDVSLGAASAWIRFPEQGMTTARVSGGAASITLSIPQGVAAQIHHQGGLSTFNVDQSRFQAVGEGMYRSPEYATAQNRLDLELDTGMTAIQVQ